MSDMNNEMRIVNDIPDEEVWKPVYWEDGSLTKYLVSSEGRVYDTRSKSMMTISDSGDKYVKMQLSHNGKTKTFLLHRLVAMLFIPNIFLKPEVNHKDGNTKNNRVSNLEWVTKSENIQHAYKSGSNTNRRLSDEVLHEICKLLSEGKMNVSQIARKMNCGRNIVSKILHGKEHKRISELYDFSNFGSYDKNIICGNELPYTKYSDDDIRKVCELIDTGEYELREIEEMTGVPYQIIRNVYYGTSRKNISKDYNFMKSKSNVLHEQKVLLVRKACALLDTGYNTKEVAEMTGLPRSTVRGIRSGYTWLEVSKEYGFMKEKIARDEAMANGEIH